MRMNRIDDRGRGGIGARSSFTLGAMLALALHCDTGCSRRAYSDDGLDASMRDGKGKSRDASMAGYGNSDLATPADLRPLSDFAAAPDLATLPDLAVPPDLAAPPDLASGPITGGPCMSGGSGATAFRVSWMNGGGRAYVNYEVNGLPSKSRWKVGAYGYSIGFTPQFVDPFLGSGGLLLDGSDFIDVELSTAGVHHIANATLAILGRSYSTGSSGSFEWTTFTGAGATPLNFVSNGAPYRWYPADATADIAPDDGGVLIRIKAGGSSGSLVVNRLELCIDAR